MAFFGLQTEGRELTFDIFWGFILAGVFLLGNAITSNFFTFGIQSDFFFGLSEFTTALTIIIIAPVVEELFFRFLLFGFLNTTVKLNFFIAALLTSVSFAAYHIWAYSQTIGVIGTVLGALFGAFVFSMIVLYGMRFKKSLSLATAIAAHMAVNTILYFSLAIAV